MTIESGTSEVSPINVDGDNTPLSNSIHQRLNDAQIPIYEVPEGVYPGMKLIKVGDIGNGKLTSYTRESIYRILKNPHIEINPIAVGGNIFLDIAGLEMLLQREDTMRQLPGLKGTRPGTKLKKKPTAQER